MQLDLLCIGHLCHDVKGDDFVLGGTASYSSMLAQHLGLSTGILTSYGSDFLFDYSFKEKGILIKAKAAQETTVFENIYDGGSRTQHLRQRAETLVPSDIPTEWAETPIVKFCTIADEVSFDCLKMFPDSLVAATIQGWLRTWDDTGLISTHEIDWDLLAPVDIVFLSDEDINGYEHAIPILAERVQILIMTEGDKGAWVFTEGRKTHYPSYPVELVDPTGAGDAFAASFLVKYAKTRNIEESMAFAHSIASLVVEHQGVYLPQMTVVNARHKEYRSKFFS